MDGLEARLDEVPFLLADALVGLVGSEVTASVQGADGRTSVLLCGSFERAVEFPWREGRELAVMVGGGSLVIRAEQVDEIDRWSFEVDGERFASVCVYLSDGTSVLIHQDL